MGHSNSNYQLKRVLTVISSFLIMLCLGGIYAWSIIASELTDKFNFSKTETQLVFGAVISIYPIIMIIVSTIFKHTVGRKLALFSALFFFTGYIIAGLSKGSFFWLFTGIGFFVGVGTGLGYLVSITIPAKWFPERKGFITGIAAAGFGMGAIVKTNLAGYILNSGNDIFQFFIIVGSVYGLLMLIVSNFIYQPTGTVAKRTISGHLFLGDNKFRKLFLAIFLGTFSGLMIIGSLTTIGRLTGLPQHISLLSISFFSAANFAGRLFWGYLSDRIGGRITIVFALTIQAISILFLGFFVSESYHLLLFSTMVGFGFGGNFVLFAKEAAQNYGLNNIDLIYPYVFMGYAIAGIAGPMTGGLFFDYFGNFNYAIIIAVLFSFGGGLIFLKKPKNEV